MVARRTAVHLLRRTEFVARPRRVHKLRTLTLEQAVDDVLDVATAGVAIPPDLTYHDENNNYAQYEHAVQWWFERMARASRRPIQEKMTLFWHGHFCSDWGKVFNTRAMMEQNKLFRDRGTTGNVRNLAKTMAVQPAMLLYLDNADNTRYSPNQNFGRELLELFLLGVGNYTEAEVEACALSWTGHNINWETIRYEFVPDNHSPWRKTLFGRTARFKGPDVIDVVLGDGRVTTGPNVGQETRRVAARFLSKKLWEAFAYAAPASTIVNALADVLVANDFAIKPWLKAMLMRSEFYSPAAQSGLVRTPTEYVAEVLYLSDRPAGDIHPEWYGFDMGQALFYPPNVSGWRINRYWVNTSAMSARASFADNVRWSLVQPRDSNRPLRMVGGSWNWNDLDAMAPGELVDTLAAAFQLKLHPDTRAALVAWARREVDQWGGIDWWRSTNAILLMMLTPELHVA